MSNYENKGNRYTAIFVRQPQKGGGVLFERAAFELVRFNVDENPDAVEEVMPIGEIAGNASGTKPDGPKIYEKIWVVDTAPFSPGAGGKHQFSNLT